MKSRHAEHASRKASNAIILHQARDTPRVEKNHARTVSADGCDATAKSLAIDV
jgi:hypothetical protein